MVTVAVIAGGGEDEVYDVMHLLTQQMDSIDNVWQSCVRMEKTDTMAHLMKAHQENVLAGFKQKEPA